MIFSMELTVAGEMLADTKMSFISLAEILPLRSVSSPLKMYCRYYSVSEEEIYTQQAKNSL